MENERRWEFSGKGVIYSFTKVLDDAPEGFEDQVPYWVALIKLDEGPMVTAGLTDFGDEKPEIGMKVEMVTRRLKADGERGILIHGYKFRPPIISNPKLEEPVSGSALRLRKLGLEPLEP